MNEYRFVACASLDRLFLEMSKTRNNNSGSMYDIITGNNQNISIEKITII